MLHFTDVEVFVLAFFLFIFHFFMRLLNFTMSDTKKWSYYINIQSINIFFFTLINSKSSQGLLLELIPNKCPNVFTSLMCFIYLWCCVFSNLSPSYVQESLSYSFGQSLSLQRLKCLLICLFTNRIDLDFQTDLIIHNLKKEARLCIPSL